MAEVRLQKVIAAGGVASRRKAEELITAGRVRVNGKVVTTLGTRVDPDCDEVRVDGEPVRQPAQRLFLMLHKPRGVVSTASDPQGRRTVLDLLAGHAARSGERRVFHIGRLDTSSEGLLLFTNDGKLAHLLQHPSTGVPRTYRARVRGVPNSRTLARMQEGIRLDDGPAAALAVAVLRHNPRSTWLEITLAEGRNRLVRRLCKAVGHPVQRLIRVAYGGVELGDLPVGAVRALVPAEIARLRAWRKSTAVQPVTTKRGSA